MMVSGVTIVAIRLSSISSLGPTDEAGADDDVAVAVTVHVPALRTETP